MTRARPCELETECDRAGLERRARVRDDKAVARALRILERRAQAPGFLMGDAVTCGSFFRLRLGGEVREHFEVAFLNKKNCLIAVERLFSGTIDGAQISPRIVAQRALALNAAAAIAAHNHPSGDPEPSDADRLVTIRLKSVLRMVDVTLLDHFVVTVNGVVSLAARHFL